MESFAARLWAAVDAKNTPAIVGLDPRPEHFPEPYKNRSRGNALDLAEATRDYHRALLDVLAPFVPAIKPQSAFFEMLGQAGWEVLWDCVDYAKEIGLMVILDAKRGDIGSTSDAYASAFLAGGVRRDLPQADALTINPYLGKDACGPFLEMASERKAGLFVLVKTSNPGAGLFQDHGSPPLADRVAQEVHAWGAERSHHADWHDVGAVVGATRPEELAHFRALMPKTPFLLPGFGFQGGTAEGLTAAFDSQGHGAVVNASRSILWAHERTDLAPLGGWQAKVQAATLDMREQLQAVHRRSSARS